MSNNRHSIHLVQCIFKCRVWLPAIHSLISKEGKSAGLGGCHKSSELISTQVRYQIGNEKSKYC